MLVNHHMVLKLQNVLKLDICEHCNRILIIYQNFFIFLVILKFHKLTN